MTKKPLFYKIYFSVIAVFLVLLVAGLCVLYAWLNEYELSQPENIIDKVYSEYIKKGDLYGLKNLGETNFSPYETKDTLNGAFKELIKDKDVKMQEGAHKLNAKTINYSVVAGENEILSLTLEKQKSGGKLGVKAYKLGSVKINQTYNKIVKISAPADAKITINGMELGKEDSQKLELPEVIKGLENSESFEVLQTYELKDFLNDKPEIKAKNGKEELSVELNKGGYFVSQKLDEKQKAEVQNFALQAAEAYAAYMQDDAPFGRVAKYLDSSFGFYESVRTTPAHFAWDHTGYEFKDVKFGDTHRYSDDVWRCRVTFKQVLHLNSTTYTDIFDKNIYLKKGANGWKVIDMLAGEE